MIWHNGIGIDREARNIHRDRTVVHFSQRRAFELFCHLILGSPKNCEQLFDLLYGHRADGGPEQGKNIINVLMSQKRPQIAKLGLELKKERGTHYWTRYQLVPKAKAHA